MKILKTKIEGVVTLEPRVFADERGYFFESFSQREFEEKVCKTTFIQDNESKSSYGVLRGLHFQIGPFAQSKLVRCVLGGILDVVVDIRQGSPTFGKYVKVRLTDKNKKQLFIPQGFAHGFVVITSQAVVNYKVDRYYNKTSEGSIAYNDKTLAIDWEVPEEKIILSEKDKENPAFLKANLV